MVGVKTSDELPAGPLTGAELSRITQNGKSFRTTLGDIAAINRTVYVEDYGAVSDGTATTGTDNSAAFAAAFTAGLHVKARNPSGRYWLKNVDIPSGRTLDLCGAIVQPAAGADYCFKLADRAQIQNGEFRDSPNNSLKSTTLTAAALAGATSVNVADSSIFFAGGLIVIVSDVDSGLTAGYGGPKLAVNHASVVSVVGNVVNLSEPLQFAAASGKAALTSMGMVVVEGSNTAVNNLFVTTVPLIMTVRSPPAGGNIGKIRITDIEANSALLGGIVELGSISSATYANCRGYLQSSAAYIGAFGHKTDGTQAVSTKGGHHFTRCDYLGTQEAFDFQDTEFISLTDCYADTGTGIGVRIGQGTNDVLITAQWAAFMGKGISVSGASARIYIYSCYTLCQTASGVPWGQNISLEVEDGCTDVYIDKNSWKRSQSMRATAGWDTIGNVKFSVPQELAEDGTAGAPSRSWRLDQDTGWYRAASGEEWFQSNGNTRLKLSDQGAGLPDGAAATPALFWVGDTDTGLHYVSSQQRVSVSGNDRFFWGDNDSGPIATPLRLPSVTLATANGLTGLTAGQQIYISNGRKVGEGVGAGTGVVAYYSNAAWRRPSDDTAVVT